MLDFLYRKKIDKLSAEEISANIDAIKLDIARLENDLASFDMQKEAYEKKRKTGVDEARAYLEDDKVIIKEEVAELKKESDTIKKAIEKVNEELDAEKRRIAMIKADIEKRADSELAKIKGSNDKEIVALKKDFDEKTNDLKVIYDKEETRIMAEAKKTLDTIEENLKRLSGEYKKIEEEVKSEEAQMIDNYNKLIEEESVRKDALTNKSATIRDSHRTKEAAIESKIDEQAQDHGDQIAKSKSDLNEEYEKMKREFDNELERQKSELLELTKRKTELTNSYNNALSDFEKTKDSLNKKYDQENEVIELESRQLQETEKKANDELMTLKDILAKKENELASYKINAQKEIDDLTTALDNKKQDVIAKHEAGKATEESTLRQALEEMRERYVEMKDSLVIDKEKEISRLNADYRMNQRRYLTKTKEIRAHYDALKGEYQDKLSSLRKANMILQDEIDSDMQKHEIKMMSLNQRLTDEDLNFKRTIQKLKEEYDAKIDAIKNATVEHRDAFEKEREALNAENIALAKEVEMKDLYYTKELATFEAQLAALKEAKETRAKNHEEVIANINAEIEATKAKITQVESEAAESETEFAKRKETFKDAHDKELADLESVHQKSIDELNSSYEKERLAIEKDLNEKIGARDEVFAGIIKEHEDRLVLKDEEFAKEEERLKNEREVIQKDHEKEYNELLKINEAKKDELARLKDENEMKLKDADGRLSTMVSEYDDKIKALKDDFIKETEDLKNQEITDRENEDKTLKELTSAIEEKRLAYTRLVSDYDARIRAKKEDIAKADHERSLLDKEYGQKIAAKVSEKEVVAKELEDAYKQIEEKAEEKNREYEAYVAKLNDELTQKKAIYTKDLQDIIATNNDARFVLLQDIEKKKNDHEASLARKEEDLLIEYKAKEAKVNADIGKLNDANERLRKDLEERLFDLKRLNSDLDRQYRDLDEKMNKEISDLKDEYDQKHRELDTNYLNTRRLYQNELADLRKATADRIKALSDHNASLRDEIVKLTQDRDMADISYKKDLEDLENDLAVVKRQIEKSKEAYSSELADCERLISALKADHSAKIDSVYKAIEDLDLQKTNLISEHKKALKKAKVDHEEAIDDKRREHEAKVKEYTESLDAMVLKILEQENVIKDAYRNKVDELMTYFNMSKQTIEERRNALKNEYDALILVEEDKNSNRQLDINRLNDDLNKELATKRDDLKLLEADYQNRVAELMKNEEAKIERYKKESEDKIAKLAEERKELTKRAKTVNEEILKAREAYNKAKDSYIKSGDKFKADYRAILDDYKIVIDKVNTKHSFFKR